VNASTRIALDRASPHVRAPWGSRQTRRGLAESLFGRVEVLGLRRMHLEPTPAAVAAELVVDAFSRASAGSGRGERGCPATNDLPVTMRLAEPPESGEWLRSA